MRNRLGVDDAGQATMLSGRRHTPQPDARTR